MIRILLGAALPILGLGAATALLGPDLLTGPRGEPLIVAGPGAATLQEARFDGTACAYPLILHDSSRPDLPAGAHALTLAFRHGAAGESVAVTDGATPPDADAALTLVFDGQGRIVAIAYPQALRERVLADAYGGCPDAAEALPAGI